MTELATVGPFDVTHRAADDDQTRRELSVNIIMFNQAALPHTKPAYWLIDVAPVVAALHRGFRALAVLRPARRSARARAESYFEYGLMRRELRRL
jgi:hypothetical protein